MARRFKAPDPKYAPKNYAEDRTPRGTAPGLSDPKLDRARQAVETGLARGKYTPDQALYLRDYLWRMRCDWGGWLDATPLTFVLLGGTQEIGCRVRDGTWEAVVAELRAREARNAAD